MPRARCASAGLTLCAGSVGGVVLLILLTFIYYLICKIIINDNAFKSSRVSGVTVRSDNIYNLLFVY